MLLLTFLVAVTQWKVPSVHFRICIASPYFRFLNVHCACGGHVDDVMILALAPEGSPEATTVKCSQGSLPWS